MASSAAAAIADWVADADLVDDLELGQLAGVASSAAAAIAGEGRRRRRWSTTSSSGS